MNFLLRMKYLLAFCCFLLVNQLELRRRIRISLVVALKRVKLKKNYKKIEDILNFVWGRKCFEILHQITLKYART
jgi:hypothetical protein